MPTLSVPSSGRLKQILQLQILPDNLVQTKVQAIQAANSSLRINLLHELSDEQIANLIRYGIHYHAHSNEQHWQTFANWFALLPLQKVASSNSDFSQLVMISLPAQELFKFAKAICQFETAKIESIQVENKQAYARIANASTSLLDWLIDNINHKCYFQARNNVWIEGGYSHPLQEDVQNNIKNSQLLISLDAWHYLTNEQIKFSKETILLESEHNNLKQNTSNFQLQKIAVPGKYIDKSTMNKPTLWLFETEVFENLIAAWPPQITRQLSFCKLDTSGNKLICCLQQENTDHIHLTNSKKAFYSINKMHNVFCEVNKSIEPEALKKDIIAQHQNPGLLQIYVSHDKYISVAKKEFITLKSQVAYRCKKIIKHANIRNNFDQQLPKFIYNREPDNISETIVLPRSTRSKNRPENIVRQSFWKKFRSRLRNLRKLKPPKIKINIKIPRLKNKSNK